MRLLESLDAKSTTWQNSFAMHGTLPSISKTRKTMSTETNHISTSTVVGGEVLRQDVKHSLGKLPIDSTIQPFSQ